MCGNILASHAERKSRLTFLPGKTTGLTDLDLEVYEEKSAYNLSFTLDNTAPIIPVFIAPGSMSISTTSPETQIVCQDRCCVTSILAMATSFR